MTENEQVLKRCDHCVSHGGMIYCEATNHPVPTTGTGEPFRPSDCPIPESTTGSCEKKPELPMTIFLSDQTIHY